MPKIRYSLFYDNHTMPACPDVGDVFDAESFTDRIKRCGVDYLTFHARCNLGMAYYDTKIGIKHPSLKYDLIGKLADACKMKDIALTVYLNGGISSAEGLQHRDWTTLYFDGREYREPRFTPYVRTMCYNTPYRDHLISMIKEIAYNYPVSGFFIDCLGAYPCVCPTCIREMKEKGIDWTNREEVVKFANFSAIRLSQDISKAVRAINPNYLLYFNGISFEDQIEIGTHLECECLPAGSWGYEYLPVLSHYIPPEKVTDKPALTVNGKVAHFTHEIFGGYNTQASVELRTIFSNVLNSFLPDPVLKTGNLPSFARAFVTEQPGRKMVHILSYLPELRGASTEMIEEPVTLNDVKISLRADARPKKVYLTPRKKSLSFKMVDGYITIPTMKGYSLLVFE